MRIPLLVLILGAASLAGQVCWSRLTAAVVGGTSAAWAITLFGAMAGLSLGAAFLRPRLVVLIVACGATLMAMPPLLLAVGRLEGFPSTRLVLTAALLMSAHVPFGAFLPTLALRRPVRPGPLLALGSLGGVVGALLSAEVLAALDHLGLILGAMVIASGALGGWGTEAPARQTRVATGRLSWPLLFAAFGLGLLGLASESLWMRVLGFYWESNTRCFAMVAASTLAGLSVGSWIAPRLTAGIAVGGAAVCLAISAATSSLAVHVTGTAGRCGLTLLLVGGPAVFSGAAFVLLLRRRSIGLLSGASSAGSAVGPLILLAGGSWTWWPSQVLFLIAAGYAALVGIVAGRRAALTGAALAVTLGLGAWVAPAGPALTDYDSTAQRMSYLRPSLESTVAVTRDPRSGMEIVWIDRGFQGDTSPLGRRIPERLGRLPCELLGRAPRHAMVIGLGTGVTLSAIVQSGASTVDVAELSAGVIDANRTILGDINGNVLSKPGVRVRHGDGRTLLLDAGTSYDLIVTDMIFPTVLGAGNLFSREFYELAGRRLTADGLFVHWLPGFLLSPGDLSSAVAAFLSEFPEGSAVIGYLGPRRLILGLAGGRIPAGHVALGPEALRALAAGADPLRDGDPRMETRSRESGDGRFGVTNLHRVMALMETTDNPSTRAWLSFARGDLEEGDPWVFYREAARLSPGTTDADILLASITAALRREWLRR